MDISETYIEMCDCEEIQSNWRPEVGDYHWRKYTVFGEELDKELWGNDNHPEITILHTKSSIGNTYFACTKDGEERIFSDYEGMVKCTSIWLPHQSQLQEMYLKSMPDGTYNKIYTLAEDFQDHHERYGYPRYATSMEQLWLAFVMKEHGKVWDGKKWIDK